MPFTVKGWQNSPSPSTPINAAALQDMEARLAAYTDSGAGPGTELAYVERVAAYTAPNTNPNDVTGLSITVVEGIRPYMVRFWCYGLTGSFANVYVYSLLMETTSGTPVQISAAQSVSGPGGTGDVVVMDRRIAPTAPGTSRSFQVRVTSGGGSIPTVMAATSAPAFLQAITL